MQDRNFDDIADKFSRNIYGTTKGRLRQAILWQDLDALLEKSGSQPLRILDGGGGVDLILFHAVLEWVAEPLIALQALWSTLREGGTLSLMFYNAHGLLMRNMVVGNFDYVQLGMPKKKRRTLSPNYPRDPAEVYRWLEAIGWQITGKTGVRVFHDYLRDKQHQRDCFDMLVELETRYCRQEPYISLGRYIHVTALKPQVQG